MPKAKAKLNRYEVTITRQIEHRATVEVDAKDAAAAEALAKREADAPRSGYWQEDHVIDQSVHVRVLSRE